MHAAVFVAILVISIVVVVFLAWLIYGLPSVAHPTRSSDFFNTIKVGLALPAGIGATIGLVVAYRRQESVESEALTQRFASAAGQLGHDRPAVRLAGVHALARLADEWEAQRQTCVDVLCAYIRMPYDPATTEPGEQEVRQTILRIIVTHVRPEAVPSWRTLDLDFSGANFADTTVDFSGANFVDTTVDFADAKFTGGTVDFADAKFIGGTVSFVGTEFTGGTVSFTGAKFAGGTVSFAGAKFTGGTVSFAGAKFTGGTVSFADAEFTGGTVSFASAKFTDGTVSFTGAKFAGGTVSFDGAEFTGGTASFVGAKFTGGTASFVVAKFAGGTVSFAGADFTGGTVSFAGAYFAGGTVDFSRVAWWTVPPENLPKSAPGLRLPAADPASPDDFDV